MDLITEEKWKIVDTYFKRLEEFVKAFNQRNIAKQISSIRKDLFMNDEIDFDILKDDLIVIVKKIKDSSNDFEQMKNSINEFITNFDLDKYNKSSEITF